MKFPYRRVLHPLGVRMRRVDPDILGYAATFTAVLSGICYMFARGNPGPLFMAVSLIFFRMTLNTLDGVIAIEKNKKTLLGDIVNVLPDRYSDVFLMAGIIFSPLCDYHIGVFAAASVFLVSFTGVLGEALGVGWQRQGPLGKVERLIMIILFSVFQYVKLYTKSPYLSLAGFYLTPMEVCMLLFIVLGQVTVYKRLKGMISLIKRKEWVKRNGRNAGGKMLVVYDSNTGNTRRVAGEIARSACADISSTEEAKPGNYDTLVFCTPNIRAKPTAKIVSLLERCRRIRAYAVCVTYGMPVWGQLSTRMCISYFRKILKKAPLSSFSCRGYHSKYGTYRGHPDDTDLLDAFLFGAKLTRKLGKA